MLRISSAASGEDIVSFEEVDEVELGSTIGSLKRHLANKHFEDRFSRFQLRLFREGDASELSDDETLRQPLDLQLMMMNHLPPDRERDESFCFACHCGRLLDVEQSLKALQNPNLVGMAGTPIGLAALQGNLHVIQLLLDAGANVNNNSTPMTALHLAAQQGHVEVVRLLLDFGADKEAVGMHQETALHWAAVKGHVNVARLLLQAGAQKEAHREGGQRPLHCAAGHGHLEVVRLLLDFGVDTEAEDMSGWRALQWAVFGHYAEVAELLKDPGAKLPEVTARAPSLLDAWNGHVAINPMCQKGS